MKLQINQMILKKQLKKKKYKTAAVGKWHLGHKHEFLPLQQGFDSFFGIPYSNDMASTVYMRGNDVVDHFPNQSLMTKKYPFQNFHK